MTGSYHIGIMKMVIWQTCSPVQRFDQPYVVHIPTNDNYFILVITGALKTIIIGGIFMDKISYFKRQAKNLLRDFKTPKKDTNGICAYSPKFFHDIDDLIDSFDIDEEHFTLMNAHHLIAHLAGFKNWSDLLHASDAALELGELLLNNRDDLLLESWNMYLYCNNFQNIADESKLDIFKMVFLPDIN